MEITAQQPRIGPGYKQTDVGVIPEDWTVEPLLSCCDYADYRGKTPPKTLSGTFLITARNVRKGFIDYEESKEYVATGQYEVIMRRGKPQIGDVLITTEAPLGNVAQVDREDVALAQRIIKYRPKNTNLSSNYLKHYLLSNRFQDILDDHASGTTAKGIKGSVLHQLPVAIPPLREQREIAKALNDADALIGVLGQLIAKKRDIKTAAMQQLLTGKQRLPGFGGEKAGYKQTEVGAIPLDWEAGCLGERTKKIGSGITPTGGERVYKKEGRPFLRSQNVGWGDLLLEAIAFIDDAIHETFKATEIEVDDVVLNITGASIGRSAVADARVAGGNVNQHVCIIRTSQEQIHPRFLNYFLLSNAGQRQIDSFQAGGNRQGLNFVQIRSFQLPIPPLPEQRAIATIFSDMDAEIAALEARRDKTRAVKQGMMQQLLTGNIRLV